MTIDNGQAGVHLIKINQGVIETGIKCIQDFFPGEWGWTNGIDYPEAKILMEEILEAISRYQNDLNEIEYSAITPYFSI